MSTVDLVIAGVNLMVCAALMWSCLCRLNVMVPGATRPVFAFKYVALFVAAGASALQPLLFGQWPTFVSVALNSSFLFVLAGGTRAWRHGVPDYARMELSNDQLRQVAGGRK